MDLPFQVVGGGAILADSTGGGSVVGGGGSGSDGNGSSRESLDSELNSEDLTSAERFASANQCTLKKNERFSSDSYESNGGGGGGKTNATDKPNQTNPESTNGTAVDDVQLRIDEDGIKDHHHHLQLNHQQQQQLHKSPIPARNTKKFVTQFADLHLTGGCMTAAESAAAAAAASASAANSQPLSSFKPQVKIKPQLMKKPQVLPPTTPEMSRRHQD